MPIENSLTGYFYRQSNTPIRNTLILATLLITGTTALTTTPNAGASHDVLCCEGSHNEAKFGYKHTSAQLTNPDAVIQSTDDGLVSNSSGSATSSLSDSLVRDILSGTLTLTSLNRSDGEDRILAPVYITSQSRTNGSSNDEFRIFHYVWKETPEHYDVEAIVGVKPYGEQYYVEIGKLTDLAIKVGVGDNRTGIIPATNETGKLSHGYVGFAIPK
jgi:hypothetical protein